MHKIDHDMPKELSDALIGEDELGLVIRSHLYIENLLDELLVLLFPCPKHYEEMQLNYSVKVRLACAMGLNPSCKSMLLAVGDIRNKFAHNLGKSIDENMVRDFHSKVDDDLRLATSEILNNINAENNLKSFTDAHPRDQYFFLVVRLWSIMLKAVNQAKRRIKKGTFKKGT